MIEVIKGLFINPDMVGMVKAISEKQCLIVLIGRNEIVVDVSASEVLSILELAVNWLVEVSEEADKPEEKEN